MQDYADDISGKKDERFSEDFETLKKDAKKLREDLTVLTSRIFEAGKEHSGSFGENIEEQGNKFIDEIDRIIKESQTKHKDKIDSLSKKIEERPILSIFIAFLAGIFISRLFGKE